MAKYVITFLVFSVFPAPDSPVINMALSFLFWSMFLYAPSAMAQRWGGTSLRLLPR